MSDIERALAKLADEGVIRLPQDPDGGEALLTGIVSGALMRARAEGDGSNWQPLLGTSPVRTGSDYTTSVKVTMRSGEYLVTVQKIEP